MDELQFIVAKLNEPPFQLSLSLVDFDEKAPTELLQLLVDVFTKLDDQLKMDVREVPKEQIAAKIVQTLNILKFKMPENDQDQERFVQGLENGEKTVIYAILHWALQRLPSLQKRAYLARFLVRVEIPPEFMQDDVLQEIHNTHRELQSQFKEVHKQVDALRAQPTKPQEIKTEITTLEDERQQLRIKIERLKKQTSGEPGFAALLEATSGLRQQQDEESRLNENMRKQRMALQHAQQRKEEAQRRLSSMTQSAKQNTSPQAMISQLQSEVRELQNRAKGVLVREMEQEQRKLAKLADERFDPQRSPEDIEAATHEVRALEDRCNQLRNQIDEDMSARGDNKLQMFRQTAQVAAKKLAAKEEELESLSDEKQRLAKEVDEMEAKLSEISGPKFMTREEFKAYGVKLREKTHVYKRMKAELADMRAELVVLHRTEQILRGRDKNLDGFLKDLEAKKGVVGYRETQEKLEKASEETANVDQNKEQTLEEISEIVREITVQLKERKNYLAPQIKLLREVRKVYQEVESEYNRKKAMYDKVAVGLEVERQQLEVACDDYQRECLQEESKYHYFNCLYSMTQAQLDRVANEEKWERGEGSFMPNFKTYTKMYQDKVTRQQALTDQLRKQKASISGNESGNMEQRRLFAELHKLLSCKLRAAKKIEEEKTGFSSSEFDMGGAKVMKIDQM